MSYEDIKSWIDLIFTRNGRKAITGDHGNQLGTKLLDYAKEFRDLKGVADGLAELDTDGKVKPDQLRDPDLSGCVKTNQDPKQILSTSPIFDNLTPGRVVIVGTDKALIDVTDLFFDVVNKRLGVNKGVPLSPIHMKSTGTTAGHGLRMEQSTNTNYWEMLSAAGVLAFIENGQVRWSFAGGGIYSGSVATGPILFAVSGNSWLDGGNFGVGTKTPDKKLGVGGTAGYMIAANEGTTDVDFTSRKTAKTFGKQQLVLAPAVLTVWASSDFRDGQVKTSKAAYYNETSLFYEQRFDWNEDLSVKRIEIKDDISGLWVQRNYVWTSGIPAITESTITAWTI